MPLPHFDSIHSRPVPLLCNVEGEHCSICGSTRPEDIDTFYSDDGDSLCCNEAIVLADQCEGHHGDG